MAAPRLISRPELRVGGHVLWGLFLPLWALSWSSGSASFQGWPRDRHEKRVAVKQAADDAVAAGRVVFAEAGSVRHRRLQEYDLPPIKVVVSNAAPIVTTWQVWEVQFYIGQCYQERKIPSYPWSGAYGSGSPAEGVEGADDTPEKAVDGSETTKWTSQCYGGCVEREAYVGLDLTSLPEWEEAQEPNNTYEVVRVRCLRYFQSDDYRYLTEAISVEEVYLDGEDIVHIILETYSDATGGRWSRRPAYKNTLWRLTMNTRTQALWRVSELEFYQDEACTERLGDAGLVPGGPISSTTNDGATHPITHAFDGDENTYWTADCTYWVSNSSRYGCYAEEAWIGLDFSDSAVTVRCFRLLQTPGTPVSNTHGFLLEAWDGGSYYLEERLWDWGYRHYIPEGEEPTLQTPYLGTPLSGYVTKQWEDTLAPNNSAVIITNDEYTKDVWRIQEIEFYEDTHCEGDATTGRSISMQGADLTNNSDVVFDGDTGPETYWESTCTTYSSGACDRQEAWIGLYFRPDNGRVMPVIQCLKFMQSQSQQYQSESINLWTWLGAQYVQQQNHRDLGGGWWNTRPAPAFTMWRAINEDVLEDQWIVAEIRAYTDELCLNETTEGTPIASGALNYAGHFSQAFDGDTLTSWGADCTICNEERKYWIGQQLPWDADDAAFETDVVRCIRIWQSENMDNQVRKVRFDIWTGEDWMASPFTENGIVGVDGGGAWQRKPAAGLSLWRIRPSTWEESIWRLLEVEFYLDSHCKIPLRSANGTGGATIALSGYRSSDFSSTESFFSEGSYAVDGDVSTSFAMNHRPRDGLPAWFAIDYLAELNYVRCVRIQQAPLSEEQAGSIKVDTWDGTNWTGWAEGSAKDPQRHDREITLEELGGGGWQRRPALDSTIWRIENLDTIPEGWVVFELEFHTDSRCSSAGNWTGLSSITGAEAISSGYIPSATNPADKYGPTAAFDRDSTSYWLSQCYALPDSLLPDGIDSHIVGCNPRDAWIGVDIGIAPQQVRCVRILQGGYRQTHSRSVALSKWDGTRYVDMEILNGLGGSTWHQRPAGPNTMWRVVHKERKSDQCRGARTQTNHRLWGVNELQFYSDQECESRIYGGTPIVSGSVEAYRSTLLDRDDYGVHTNAFDGDQDSVWAANCKLGWTTYNVSKVDCNNEWIGLSFDTTAVEVRCIRVMQSHIESSNCCDPAKDLQLERWNGSDWLEADWKHEAPDAAEEDFRMLGAHFTVLGECPADSSTANLGDVRIWEQRTRKDSENCILPLTGATLLLAKPFCMEHPGCVSAVGADGRCCPVGDGSTSESRCCCSFLESEAIYQDEGELNPYRRDFNVELAIIELAQVLPIPAGAIALILWISALTIPAKAQEVVATWAAGRHHLHGGCRRKARRFLAFLIWPLLAWRAFLAEQDDWTAATCRWFCLPGPNRDGPRMSQVPRGFLFIVICAWLGGAFPWITMGFLMGEVALKLLIFLSLVIRLAASPYDPSDARAMQLREYVSKTRIDKDDDTATAHELLYGLVGTFLAGIIFFLKFVFDVLILRYTLIAYDMIETVESERIIDIFPGPVASLKEPAMFIYDLLYWGSQLMSMAVSEMMGIPKCEGACVLIAALALVLVLSSTSRWISYDLFGLFAAAKQVSKKTKPECQRVLSDGLVLLSLSLQFGIVQCAMLLFTRALKLASPLKELIWYCDYDDLVASIIGRVFIVLGSIFGIFFVFLASNGHFLGQDYVTAHIAKNLGINLEDLDPDGTGPGGGWVRWSVAFSSIPTIFGAWFDGWNIRGYLIEERCRIYAGQMQEAQPCRICGKVHIKYNQMMIATGRQVSLALQIVPFGSVAGKMAEYFNDPPIFYFGEKLECFRPWVDLTLMKLPENAKDSAMTKILLFVATCCSYGIELVIPLLRRLATLTMFSLVVMATFTITEENLVEWGGQVITWAFYLAFAKAGGELFLEVLLSYILGLIHKKLSGAWDVRDAAMESRIVMVRTVLGQALAGSCIGTILAVIFPDTNTLSGVGATLLAGGIGYLYSLLIAGVQVAVELPAVRPGDPPFNNPSPTIVKVLVSFGSGIVICILCWQIMELRAALAFAMFTACVEVLAMKVIMVERRIRSPGVDPTSPDEGRMIASPTLKVMMTKHILPALAAIPVGSLVGELTASVVTDSFLRVLMSVITGMGSATVIVLAINRFQEQTAQITGFLCGAFVWACVMQWNWLVALCLSAAVFAGVGSVIEEWEIREKAKVLVKKWEAEDRRKAQRQFKKGQMTQEELEIRMMSKGSVNSQASLPDLTREQKMIIAQTRLQRGLPAYPGAVESRMEINGVPLDAIEDKRAALENNLHIREEARLRELGNDSESESEPLDLAPPAKAIAAGTSGAGKDSPSKILRAAAEALEDEHLPGLKVPVSPSLVEEDPSRWQDAPQEEATDAAPEKGEKADGRLATGESGEDEAKENDDEPGPLEHGTSSTTLKKRPAPPPLTLLSATVSELGSAMPTVTAGNGQPVLAQPQAAAAAGSGLVDNFKLERDDDDDEASPALIGWDDRPEDEEALRGRWDTSPPKAMGHSTKKRTRAAPIKPSLWGAVQGSGPPGLTPPPQVKTPNRTGPRPTLRTSMMGGASPSQSQRTPARGSSQPPAR